MGSVIVTATIEWTYRIFMHIYISVPQSLCFLTITAISELGVSGKADSKRPPKWLRRATYPLVDPLVHRRLPLLGPFNIEDFDEGFDCDSLKIRARLHIGVVASERGLSERGNARLIKRLTQKCMLKCVCGIEILGFRSIAQQSTRAETRLFLRLASLYRRSLIVNQTDDRPWT